MKKVFSLILSFVMAFSILSLNTVAANPKIKSLKIVTKPTKTEFYQNTDWVYGVWDINESTGKVTKVESDKISFTHNAGCGNYPERGMIDMTGLKIEVTYTDGTKKTIEYKETKGKNGLYTANILASPQGGKGYFVGTNTVEVYLSEDTSKYDTYTVKLIAGSSGGGTSASGDVDGNGKLTSNDALMVLQHSVALITLNSDQKKRADMNSDGKINSTDALMILKKAVA